jgi:hypothetical protein
LPEFHLRRLRDAFAEGKGFAGAERRQESEKVRRGVRDRRAQQPLVALIGHAHREQRAALRQDR